MPKDHQELMNEVLKHVEVAPAAKPSPKVKAEGSPLKEPHERLAEVLKYLDKSKVLNIFMHNRPDPDTMACALALEKIANHFGQNCRVFYSQESDFLTNRLVMNMLSLPFTKLESLESPEDVVGKMDYVALVDVAGPDKVSYYELLESKVVIDIDHHNGVKAMDVPGRFFYRKSCGACTSILIDWLDKIGITLNADLDKPLVLAAYLGIKVDTSSFAEKSMDKLDRDAKKNIEIGITDEDYKLLYEIENPEVPLAWSKKLGEVLLNFPSGKSDLFYHGIGVVDETGVIPYIAEEIFKRRNFSTVIIYGICYRVAEGKVAEIKVKAAGRSRDNSLNLSEAFSEVFYKRTEDGKRIHRGGGRKSTVAFVSYAGADIPLDEENELNPDGMQKLYELWDRKINSRVETVFKTSKKE